MYDQDLPRTCYLYVQGWFIAVHTSAQETAVHTSAQEIAVHTSAQERHGNPLCIFYMSIIYT